MAPTREQLQNFLLPEGIPRLWRPAITHFTPTGRIDAPRMAAHARAVAPHSRGLLIPGSTGEGWQLTADQETEVQTVMLDLAPQLASRVLIGILKADLPAMHRQIDTVLTSLRQRTPTYDGIDLLVANRVAGFVVCPPHGSQLTSAEIEAALTELLSRGLPLAIYQLPQVTQNEVSPATMARLAEQFSNLLLFKDTSGFDRVAQASHNLHGVFLVRGAEGGYARVLREGGGPYDGFLLSTANALAAPLAQVISSLAAGHSTAAYALSQRIEQFVTDAFALVQPLTIGNPFANASKLMDHVLAYGDDCHTVPMPRLCTGESLPQELIGPMHNRLQKEPWYSARGYLSTAP